MVFTDCLNLASFGHPTFGPCATYGYIFLNFQALGGDITTLESMLQVFLKRKCGGSLLAAWRRHLDRHASMSVTWK